MSIKHWEKENNVSFKLDLLGGLQTGFEISLFEVSHLFKFHVTPSHSDVYMVVRYSSGNSNLFLKYADYKPNYPTDL